jgi:hypothetical protein
VIHYHGTPITPRGAMSQLGGCCFCVSFATYMRGKDLPRHAHEIGQSVMLDNGAFSFWKSKVPTDWDAYMTWAEPWLHYPTTWAVIPDVIDGSEEDNDLLLVKWFQRRLPRGAPVWHMHESIDRLKRLCVGYERVCIGSSGMFREVGSGPWHRRMEQAMNAVCRDGTVSVWLHMLRGMSLSGSEYPFASVDSTDIAQNHNRPQNTPERMARRWDSIQNPCRWEYREHLTLEAA